MSIGFRDLWYELETPKQGSDCVTVMNDRPDVVQSGGDVD